MTEETAGTPMDTLDFTVWTCLIDDKRCPEGGCAEGECCRHTKESVALVKRQLREVAALTTQRDELQALVHKASSLVNVLLKATRVPTATKEQIEAFRREQWMPQNGKPLEPWAIEENRVLTAICDFAINALEPPSFGAGEPERHAYCPDENSRCLHGDDLHCQKLALEIPTSGGGR